jgi:benzil reductase ((S)-benzoin forming)
MPFSDIDNEDIKKVINCNVVSPMIIINALLKKYKDKKIKIVNISSGLAHRAMSGFSLYCSTKAAMAMFCEVIKLDCPNIEIINIDPGVMDTKMQQIIRNAIGKIKDKDMSIFKNYKENKILQTPQEVAKKIIDIILK